MGKLLCAVKLELKCRVDTTALYCLVNQYLATLQARRSTQQTAEWSHNAHKLRGAANLLMNVWGRHHASGELLVTGGATGTLRVFKVPLGAPQFCEKFICLHSPCIPCHATASCDSSSAVAWGVTARE